VTCDRPLLPRDMQNTGHCIISSMKRHAAG
jgi:hypothetical protein